MHDGSVDIACCWQVMLHYWAQQHISCTVAQAGRWLGFKRLLVWCLQSSCWCQGASGSGLGALELHASDKYDLHSSDKCTEHREEQCV
jgi:hypothetical protein